MRTFGFKTSAFGVVMLGRTEIRLPSISSKSASRPGAFAVWTQSVRCQFAHRCGFAADSADSELLCLAHNW